MAGFEALVEQAVEAVPAELMALLENVVFVVEEVGEHPDILGLYDGIPLTEREDYGGFGMVMPDQVFIYRRPLCAMCATPAELVEQVTVTVVHEIAHYFGIDDERLHDLGWG